MAVAQLLTLHLAFLLVFGAYFAQAKEQSHEWDYDHHHTKQEDWTGTCRNGTRQSPINIITKQTTKIVLTGHSLVFNGYDKIVSADVLNNGHTVVLKFTNGPEKDIWIKDGGLSLSKFEFAQAHFHWGDTDDQGSEHKINGQADPMEMHLVHWNLDVGKTMNEAVGKDTGISLEVLGVRFKIGNQNEKFASLFDAIKNVKTFNSNFTMQEGITLNDLLPENTDAFYRYKGSLTTPGCNEVVMWTLFKNPIEISREQIEVMRKTTYHHKNETDSKTFDVAKIANNYRDTKDCHGREILDVDVTGTSGGISTKTFFLKNKALEVWIFVISLFYAYLF